MNPLLMKTYSFIYHILSVLFSICIIYYSLPGSSLFSWHPVTTAMAVTVIMSQGLVIFDPAFSVLGTHEQRQNNVNRHLVIQLCAGLLIVVGFVVVFVNKSLQSKNHFISWHSYFGLALVVLLPFVVGAGFVVNYGLRFGKLLRPYQMKWAHGVAGLVFYTLATVTCGLGLFSNWAVRNIAVPQRLVLGSVLAVLSAVVWDRARSRFLLKIFQIPSAAPS